MKKFFVTLLLLISVIWFSKTISFIKYITENGVDAYKFFALFILILPSFMIYLIPISLFIAVLVSLNKMMVHNEISIFRNSHLSDSKISAPIIKISIYMSILSLLIYFFIAPFSNQKLSVERNNIKNNYSNISFKEGVFENLKDITIFVNKKEGSTNFRGIVLNDNRNKEVDITIISESGYLVVEEGSLMLLMHDGQIQRYSRKEMETSTLRFDQYAFNLSEDGKVTHDRKWKMREVGIFDLIAKRIIAQGDQKHSIDVEIHKRISISLMSIAITLISLMFMMSKEFSRRGNMYSIICSVICVIIFSITLIALIRASESDILYSYVSYIFYF